MRGKEQRHERLMRSDINYIVGIQLEDTLDIIRHCFFSEKEIELLEYEVYSPADFAYIYTKWLDYKKFENCLDSLFAKTGKKSFYYSGVCSVCNSVHTFIMDERFAEIVNNKKNLNWRERLVCPNCHCNSRERFLARKIFDFYQPGSKILLYEQATNFFQKIRREIPSACGFEYMGNGYYEEREINGIHCEDICKMNFADEEFDLLVSNDIFGLTVDYKEAFREAHRVLRPDGKLIFTIPFDGNSVTTIRRVKVTAEGIVNLEPIWYYNNPVNINCPRQICEVFGWDILETLKDCGFKKSCGKVYYGLKEAYMGYLPIYFEAYKE